MKKLLAAFFLLLVTSTAADALTFDYEHVSGLRLAPPYGWFYSYDIGYIDNTLKVDIDVQLYGATPATTLLDRWERGIESIWSTNRFAVPILFDVEWVASSSHDYMVQVIEGLGRWNMLNWYTVGAGGWGDSYQEEVAAHEYGHMLSLFDEYAGGAVNPATGQVNTGGLMHTLDGPAFDYYYDPFFEWYERKIDTVDNGGDPVATPEPSTLLLLGMGLVGFAGVVVVRRRQATS